MRLILVLAFLFLAGHPTSSQTTSIDQSDLEERLEAISCLYAGVLIEGLQYFPAADWQLRCLNVPINSSDTLKAEYNLMVDYYGALKSGSPTEGISHFDWIANFPPQENRIVARDLKITSDTLSLAQRYILMEDPYASGYLLGYISIPGDFALISVGPDGVPDILPFSYRKDDKQLVDRKSGNAPTCTVVESTLKKYVFPTSDSRNTRPVKQSLRIPLELIYMMVAHFWTLV
jgi:hypothetical protein